MTVKKPEEKSEDKKVPKRLYIKIPKGYYTSTKTEQNAFVDALYTQMMGQIKENNEEQGKE